MTTPTDSEKQIERITEAFCHEMTVRYWQPSIMTVDEFRECILNDLQRFAVIIKEAARTEC